MLLWSLRSVGAAPERPAAPPQGRWGQAPGPAAHTHTLPVATHTQSVSCDLLKEKLLKPKQRLSSAQLSCPELSIPLCSSVALTRSGWQQEFVSPPNLEITFSGARRAPSPSLPPPSPAAGLPARLSAGS